MQTRITTTGNRIPLGGASMLVRSIFKGRSLPQCDDLFAQREKPYRASRSVFLLSRLIHPYLWINRFPRAVSVGHRRDFISFLSFMQPSCAALTKHPPSSNSGCLKVINFPFSEATSTAHTFPHRSAPLLVNIGHTMLQYLTDFFNSGHRVSWR